MRSGLLGLYWGPRQQSLDECADQCLRTLQAMQKSGFDGFFQLGWSRKDALRQAVVVLPEVVRSILECGVNRHDDNQEPILDLGWRMSLWSGRPEDESFSLRIHCGSFSKWVGNNVVIKLPPKGPHSLAVSRAQAEQLFDVLVILWQPEQAVLCHADEMRWEGRKIPAQISAFRRLA